MKANRKASKVAKNREENMRQFIDLSHTVEHGMTTYKGLPAPIISDYLSRPDSRKHYGPGTEFHIGRIEMVANTGTYLDAPFHRFANGADLCGLELSSIADVEGVLIRCIAFGSRAIGPELFRGQSLSSRAVLIHTRWDRHWRTDRYSEGHHPFLSRDAAQLLVRERPALVGIDSFNIDDITDGSRPAHTLLLGAGIPVVEHLTGLEQLPDKGFRFFAVPVKVKGLGSFPVRCFAILRNDAEAEFNRANRTYSVEESS
jgi:kynurenine formamidase